MTRADNIRAEIARLEAELAVEANPYDNMTARELARATGTSPSTASRFKKGELESLGMGTVMKYMKYSRFCPLCGCDTTATTGGRASTPAATPTPEFQTRRKADKLHRFRVMHAEIDAAIEELRAGQKRGHWMWFVFPQLQGLGHSENALRWGVADLDEAIEMTRDDAILFRWLAAIDAVVNNFGRGMALSDIFPLAIDGLKFRSSVTLLSAALIRHRLHAVDEDVKDELGRVNAAMILVGRCTKTEELLP